MPKAWVLLLSCEHAGYKIPKVYASKLDEETKTLLSTHRGWDKGALALAKDVSKTENAPLFFTEISRLLVDCNRSLPHKNCFGPAFRDESPEMKEQIAFDYYHPYRQSVVDAIERFHKKGVNVLHCAFHSFTPVLNGETRKAELGLLYDPARISELEWADRMMATLRAQEFPWRVRRNYPYLGKSDGFTRFLRDRFLPENYAGFEIEFNQMLFQNVEDAKNLTIQMLQFFASLGLQRP
ncbi:MAG: N-formylglutamate amidohydrolase [Chitinophagaceae bacterium]|nr:N-formylglutamate amidohydrolase [Oligoflexus sp.]